MLENLWDKFWYDREGNLVVWQRPNALLIVWAALTFISLFFIGKTADILSGIASLALIGWSLLEILQGANYFRRVLGIIVLVFSVAALIKSL